MRYSIRSVLFCFIFFVTFAVFSKTVNVTINTNLLESMIFLNDEFVGNGNVELNLSAGTYEVLVSERNRGWNAQRFNYLLNLNENTSIDTTITVNFSVKKFLDTKPQNAEIIFQDDLYAYTPSFIPDSLLQFEVVKPNYINYSQKFLNVVENEIKIMEFVGANERRSFVESPWFEVLVSSAVICGATAAYYKIEADKLYDTYKITKDGKTLQKVNQYDTYSGIAFGLLQVNFGYLIYEFIFNSN